MNKSFFLMLTAFAFAACGSDEVEPTPTPDPKPELVKMSFLVNAGEETRTVLMHGEGKENQVWFHDGDEICIFDNTDKHKFTTTLTEDAPSATFTGEAYHTAAGFFYALYPYQEIATFTNTDTIPYFLAEIPSTQTPVAASFDPKANVSVARIPMEDYTASDFVITKLYNACALVKFTSTIDLKSVKLESASACLSGDMNIELKNINKQAPTDLSNLTFSDPHDDYTFNSVELKNPDGSAFTVGTYYIAVWPGTHSSLTITLTNSSGQTKTGTLSSVTFERAKILNLGNF